MNRRKPWQTRPSAINASVKAELAKVTKTKTKKKDTEKEG
jgi:hypothetical protein